MYNKQDVHDLYLSNIELLYKLLTVKKLEDIQKDIDDAEYQISHLDEFWEKASDRNKEIVFESLNNLNKVYTFYSKKYL